MRIAHYDTTDFGYDVLDLYTQDMSTLIGPMQTSNGDTIVLVDDDHREEIDNMNHLVGVNYLYDTQA